MDERARIDAVFFGKVQDLLFRGGAQPPRWLDQRAEALARHYSPVRTTAAFDAIVQGYTRSDGRPFELFVVGEGNYGKSTLVNALIGSEISKVHFLPTTRCFLRFVSVENPSDSARLYVRRAGPAHDWITDQLGTGTEVKELFDISEYAVPKRKAEEMMAEETRRLDHEEGYEQAIYEMETEIPRNRAGILCGKIRLVDTQGLNQLFPKEIQSMAEELDEEKSEKRFEKWMAGTPRGKHLEWQFRRCDAVIWLLNAKKSSSAASTVALRYFSKYGKVIVGVVTHIDRIQGEENRKRVIEQIERNYGSHMDVVVPVNARLALEGRLANDARRSKESGYFEVERNLESVCLVNGMRTASIGRYNSMRTTEKQIRRGLEIQKREINECLGRMKEQKEDIGGYCAEKKEDLQKAVRKAGQERFKRMKGKVTSVELSDTAEMANQKLSVADEGRSLWNVVDTQMDTIIEGARDKVVGYNEKPYTMPEFDADGKRARSFVEIGVQLKKKEVQRNRAQIQMQLDVPGFWSEVEDFLKENPLTEFLFPGVAQRHREKRSAQRREKQSKVESCLKQQWNNYVEESIEAAGREIGELEHQVIEAIDEVERNLEFCERRPLRDTRKVIETIAEDMIVKPILVDMLVGAIRKKKQSIATGQAVG